MSSKKSKNSKSTNSKSTVTNTSNAKGVKVSKDRTVGAHVPASEQCEHKTAKHHSKGLCVVCYNAKRNKKKPTKATRKTSARKLAA
jgi:hypothetical protein